MLQFSLDVYAQKSPDFNQHNTVRKRMKTSLFISETTAQGTWMMSGSSIWILDYDRNYNIVNLNLQATKLFIATSATKGEGLLPPPRFSVRFKILYRVLQPLIQHCLLRKMVYLNIIWCLELRQGVNYGEEDSTLLNRLVSVTTRLSK